MAKDDIKIVIDDRKIRRTLKQLTSLAVAPILTYAGAVMKESTDRNFEVEGRYGTGEFEGGSRKWKKLKPATVARKAKEGLSSKILQGHGDLRQSITSQIKGGKLIHGTNKVYAKTHQYGDDSRNIPKRPFITIQKADMQKISKFIVKYVKQLLR